MSYRKLVVAAGALHCLSHPVPAFAEDAPSPEAATTGVASCEVHVWQSDEYFSDTSAPYAALGLLGVALQGVHDKKYPPDTVESQMEDDLDSKAIQGLIAGLPWAAFTNRQANDVIVEKNLADADLLKTLKSTKARNTNSSASC